MLLPYTITGGCFGLTVGTDHRLKKKYACIICVITHKTDRMFSRFDLVLILVLLHYHSGATQEPHNPNLVEEEEHFVEQRWEEQVVGSLLTVTGMTNLSIEQKYMST